MSTRRSVILSSLLAVIVAFSIIIAAILAGFSPNQISSTSTQTSTATTTVTMPTTVIVPTTITSQSTTVITTTTTVPTTSVVTTTSTVSPPPTGILSIMFTDPPNVPEGVTEVHINYSDFYIHAAKSDENHGWINLNIQGSINLMDVLEVAETIASLQLEDGKYNLIKFNVTSAKIIYEGNSYPAFIQTGMLSIPIIGGIEVKSLEPTAAIIDFSPTVFNLGNLTDPEFVISAVAKAYTIPVDEVTPQIHRRGYRLLLKEKLWWKHLREMNDSELEITSASLSADSISVDVKNVGTRTVQLRFVIVSKLKGYYVDEEKPKLQRAFFGTQIFLITKNGELKSFLVVRQKINVLEEVRQLFQELGYPIEPNASFSLSYNGSITFGYGYNPGKKPLKVEPGTQYVITVIGEETLTSKVVVAS